MLIFEVKIAVNATKWKNEEMKKTFMNNAEDIIQEGLNMMTVPDWTVTVEDVVEIEDEY